MVRTSSKAHVLALLTQELTSSTKHLSSPAEPADIFDQLRSEWGLPKSLTRTKFQELVLESRTLQEVQLTATYPLHTKRYHWGNFTPYELAPVLAPRFLSFSRHCRIPPWSCASPARLRVRQQRAVRERPVRLATQANLKRAFCGKQRQSNFIVTH